MEFKDLRSRMYRVGNYIKESTTKSLDGLKSDRRLGSLQDEINDAYRMLGYLFYTEMKAAGPEGLDDRELCEKSAEIVSKLDEKCEEIEQIKKEIEQAKNETAAEAVEKNANSNAAAFCIYCGTALDGEARFCSKCGKPVK